MTPLALPHVRSRLRALRRDLLTVASDLVGRKAAPFEARGALQRHHHLIEKDMLASRTLRIGRVVRETKDAVTLHLVDPYGARVDFLPGQFLTLVVEIDGEPHRRAYSICSAMGEGLAVTVKRIAGGRVSSHLNDHAREGNALRVLGPSGSFGLTPRADAARHVVLIGGGSGITPLMSIARSVLAGEPASRVTLLFGNRDLDDVIFRTALAELATDPRLVVRHVLESPPAGWMGGTGRLDASTCARELAALCNLRTGPNDAEYFLCGPEPMMVSVREALAARGVERLHEERFSSPTQRTSKAIATTPQPIMIRFGKSERSIVVEPGQTLLEAGLAAGVAMPFSCAVGGCGRCKVKLVDGDVADEEPNCLTREERDRGQILACVSRPSGLPSGLPGQSLTIEIAEGA